MVVSSAQLEEAIRSKIENVSTVIVSDVSGGCGQAYDVVIVSDAFEGIPTLKRHRMVNDHLKDQIAQLHAFSQTTMTTKQYAARAASDAAPASTSSTTSSLQTAATSGAPGTGQKSSTQHGRTPSAISIPELTLTTDTASGDGGFGGGSGLASGQLTPSSSVSMVGETPSPVPQSPRISRLQLSKLQSVEFWLSLRDFLEGQFGAGAAAAAAAPAASPSLEAAPTTAGGRASPSRGHSPSNSISLARAPGEAEAAQVWENFFLSAKDHLSASEIARVRDVVGAACKESGIKVRTSSSYPTLGLASVPSSLDGIR
ncbi:hypothetical protein CF327_g4950 [Tilletia walkeri]|nr:hypothetical protein CF327_g4950 [Tilletia walkeri]